MSKQALNGIKVRHHKNTMECAAQKMPIPDRVVIPMNQHIGAPCEPTVKMTDLVKVGQVIGKATGFVSAPIHASVSGKVVAINDFIMPNGARSKAVVIESDKEQALFEGITPPVVTNLEQFVQAVRDSGLVGLGGAGFPTSVKLSPKNLDAIDTLVVNAAECEPYITSDYRVMMEEPEGVLDGISQIRKFLSIKKIVMGIEDNKPQAIKQFSEKTTGDNDFTVHTLKSKYPQGAEKVLIYECVGRVVPEGKLPMDVGVIVINVATVAFISKYLKTGIPLVEKRVTVDGSAIKNPMNVVAPIGASIQSVLDFAGGFKCEVGKILMGGPMMGISVPDIDYPLLKNNNAILAFNETDAAGPIETPCIRCGRCADACPVNLMPAAIERAYKAQDAAKLESLKVGICMECGCCSYVCPAKRNLAMTNKLAKKLVNDSKK